MLRSLASSFFLEKGDEVYEIRIVMGLIFQHRDIKEDLGCSAEDVIKW